MGWSSFHVEKGRKTLDVLAEEFGSGFIVDGRVKGGTAYLACQQDGKTFGAVVLIRRSRDYYNFTYKFIDEGMGPSESECPKAILDLLDPEPLNDYSANWRARCRANLEKSAEARKVKGGDRVRFAEPMEFTDGVKRDTFRFVSHSTFVADDGVTVRVTRWRNRAFEVLSPAIAG